MQIVIKSILSAAMLACILVTTGCGGKNTTIAEQTRNATRKADHGAEIYKAAKHQIEIGGYDRAIDMMEQLALYFPFSEYTRRSKLDLIYAYYKVGNEESAIDAANEFIRENPTHPDVDYAYYLRGLIYFGRGKNPLEKIFRVDLSERPGSDAERSLSYFNQLIVSYPNSQYAPDAKQRIVNLRERLAQYENHVARYYLSRRAWVAAAARAKNVVQEYQDTAEVTEALQIMSRSYRELGLDDLALDAERVLRENNMAVEATKKKRRWFRRDKKVVPERPAS